MSEILTSDMPAWDSIELHVRTCGTGPSANTIPFLLKWRVGFPASQPEGADKRPLNSSWTPTRPSQRQRSRLRPACAAPPAVQSIEDLSKAGLTLLTFIPKSIEGEDIPRADVEKALLLLGEGTGMAAGLPLGGAEQLLKVVCGLSGHPIGKKKKVAT